MATKLKLGGPRKIFLEPGYRVNNLTVIKEIEGHRFGGKNKRIKRQYLCQCDCGNRIAVTLDRIMNGRAKSCGCRKNYSPQNRTILTCPECGREFALKSTFTRHVEAFHSDIGKEYICTSCHKIFHHIGRYKIGRLIRCPDCKRNVEHANENIESLLQMSKRTITKVLSRAKLGCSICGWNDATCDVHHIVPKKSGGSDENENLIILCPNCHRKVHCGTMGLTKEDMKKMSVVNQWEKLVKVYHPSN